MTTINLRQNQGDDAKKISIQGAYRGFFFSLSILIFTIGVFIGLKPYISSLEKENALLTSQIETQKSQVAELKNLERLMDLESRLKEITNNLEIKNGAVTRLEMNDILDNMSSDLHPGVVVSNYKYTDDGGVEVQFDSSNFSDAARQVLNFKKSNNFTDVELKNIARNESSIVCSVSMKIKNI